MTHARFTRTGCFFLAEQGVVAPSRPPLQLLLPQSLYEEVIRIRIRKVIRNDTNELYGIADILERTNVNFGDRLFIRHLIAMCRSGDVEGSVCWAMRLIS